MKFEKYDFKDVEPQVLEYWEQHKVVEKLRAKNAEGSKFYFLDGPPYTSGKFHLGHAWNYALKDIALRYKRSHGLNVWDRNGFDVHGLPTEHKVMEKFKLETKEDIQKFGLDKFMQECEKFCLEMAGIMTKDLRRMGVTVDSSNPYMALQTEFMEGEWALIKKAYEQKKLYYGEKVLTWCQHCETAVAKHECEYQKVKDNSIFVKFKVRNKKNEYLIVWTTTPWTIPFNLAVMVHPHLDYQKVDVGGEKWILAKALANVVVQAVAGRTMKVVEEFKGEKIRGLKYVHPFEKLIPEYAKLEKKHPNVHTVILSEQYVDTSAGSGLVHAAPGCGPEDQEACKPYKIPPFNVIDEQGFFPKDLGPFAGLRAKVHDDQFIDALRKEGALIETTVVEHDYPHCWRCKKPVVFRITYQWFFNVEDLREQMLAGNKDVHWVPDTALHAYESWIRNLKDNSITRQRYWGTPVPIWKCTDKKCSDVIVIGSRDELKKRGGKVPQNLHIPWIDEVELACHCGKTMKRVPDVIDVWVDAGTASWNCLDNDPKKMKELYPADLILEAKEQTRLWFSMLSICSYLYLGKNAFKNVYVYGMLNDIDGRKMSKSLGNVISPYELIDKHGVDVLRYYMCQNNAGQDINFSWEECVTKQRYLNIFWNVHKFLITLAHENKLNPYKLDGKRIRNILGVEEKYIFSKLHSTIKTVTELFEQYRLDETIVPLEQLFLELSRTYIQMVRDKSALGDEQEKEVCIYTIGYVLMETLKMMGIIAPFIAEAMYLNLKEEFGLKESSISHYSWPALEEKFIDPELERSMETVQQLVQAALNAREKAKLGLRWPVKEVVVVSKAPTVLDAVERLRDVVQKQVNAKSISVLEKLPGVSIKIKPDFGKIGSAYGALSPQILAKLTIDSPETIIGHLDQEKVYAFEISGKPVKITRDHVTIERTVPAQYREGEFWQGLVYLNLERTADLEAEGYAREVMRHVQQLRKEAKLAKLDRIDLKVHTSSELGAMLRKFQMEIEEKVGAEKMELVLPGLTQNYQLGGEFVIKKEKVQVWFRKV